jgi:hypothetical protein
MEREADNERPGGKRGLFGEVIVPDDGGKKVVVCGLARL